jgi:signal peptidase I
MLAKAFRLVALPVLLILLSGIFLFARRKLLVVTVENVSMYPNLLPGDRVLAVRTWPRRWIRRGDIVLVGPWSSGANSEKLLGKDKSIPFIKRVVGLSGDTLQSSILEVDEVLRPHLLYAHDSEGHRLWHIPPGHVFVRGDNPIGGFDSLSWGPIPFQSILAVVILRLSRNEAGGAPGNSRVLKSLTTNQDTHRQPAPELTTLTLSN